MNSQIRNIILVASIGVVTLIRSTVYAAETNAVPVKEFHLYTIDGELTFADDTTTYVVGYSTWDDKMGAAPEPLTDEMKKKLSSRLTVPGPTIRVKLGDHVRVVLHNAGHILCSDHSAFHNVPHTIHFHGLDLIQPMDGVPDLPLPAITEGKSYAYDFVPDYEGTYMYHCHVDSSTHIMLGMYGALIVEGDTPNMIYGYKYDREYTLMYSEMDTKFAEAIREKGRYNLLDWKTDYWLLNGRIFVDNLKNPLSTVNDPNSRIVCHVGETVLLRMLAVGMKHTFAIHPHGYHFTVIGTDGRKFPFAYEKDTLPIVSGERYDVLIHPGPKHKGLCTSCNIGKGISIMHDHNLAGEASDGVYPKGPLTIVEVN